MNDDGYKSGQKLVKNKYIPDHLISSNGAPKFKSLGLVRLLFNVS